MKTLEIHLIRHGQTLDNASSTIAGQQPGYLSELGIKQATITGLYLKDQIFDVVYCSDLNRTRHTFELIASSMVSISKTPVFFEALLREKGGGILEGKSLELPKKMAAEQGIPIREFKVEKGESWIDVNNRAKKFINILVERHLVEGREEFESLEDRKKEIIEKEEEKTEDQEVKPQMKEINCEKERSKGEILAKGILNSKDEKNLRVMVVTHGGFIMEFMNVIGMMKNNENPVFKNSATNCSITTLKITKKDGKKALSFDFIRKNDNKHITDYLEKEKNKK
jgi:broad specificity phosphatase PhoE